MRDLFVKPHKIRLKTRHFKYMRFVSHLSRFVSRDPCNSSVTCMGSHENRQTFLVWRFSFSDLPVSNQRPRSETPQGRGSVEQERKLVLARVPFERKSGTRWSDPAAGAKHKHFVERQSVIVLLLCGHDTRSFRAT